MSNNNLDKITEITPLSESILPDWSKVKFSFEEFEYIPISSISHMKTTLSDVTSILPESKLLLDLIAGLLNEHLIETHSHSVWISSEGVSSFMNLSQLKSA